MTMMAAQRRWRLRRLLLPLLLCVALPQETCVGTSRSPFAQLVAALPRASFGRAPRARVHPASVGAVGEGAAAPWVAANLTVFTAAGKGVHLFPPAEPCHMPHDRNSPISFSLVGPFPRGVCCTSWGLLNATTIGGDGGHNASGFNMSIFFDGRVMSAYLGGDCTSRDIVVRNGTANVTVNSFVGNLSSCLSASVGKVLGVPTVVGLSLVPAKTRAAVGVAAACPTSVEPYTPLPPPPPPPPPSPLCCANDTSRTASCVVWPPAARHGGAIPPNCSSDSRHVQDCAACDGFFPEPEPFSPPPHPHAAPAAAHSDGVQMAGLSLWFAIWAAIALCCVGACCYHKRRRRRQHQQLGGGTHAGLQAPIIVAGTYATDTTIQAPTKAVFAPTTTSN
jgi:hypothetical protein